MARPVMPDDEAFEYLPTQAVADFLGTMNEPRLDGIVFPSVQTGKGRNVVLFHHAARVETLSLPPGTEIGVNTGYQTDDGWEPDYSVSEAVPEDATAPPPCPVDPDEELTFLMLGDYSDPPECHGDFREPALKVETEALTVHTVNAVKVKATTFPVYRNRHVARPSKY